MNSSVLEDTEVNVKVKIAAIWAALTFAYAYADILGFYSPGNIAEILTGEIAGVPLTQEMLLAMAVLMAIPIVMIFVSLILKAKLNRVLNIILGIFHIILLIVSSFVAITAYYMVFVCVEFICLVLIVWFAYKWPTE